MFLCLHPAFHIFLEIVPTVITPVEICYTKDEYGPCVFPFTYEGKSYEKCTEECTFNCEGNPWCAYEVDASGVMTSGKWWYCEDTQECKGKNRILN